jgi:hypothetical protein
MAKEKKAKKLKVKKIRIVKKLGFWGRLLRWIVRHVKSHPRVIYLTGEPLPTRCIMIGNHNGAGGPVSFRTFLKENYMTWGAHQMTEGFFSRRRYLSRIFYRQKLGYGPIKSFLFAFGLGIFAPLPYTAAGTIPIYYDSRLRHTIKWSIEAIENDVPILAFPEDSEEGYKEIIKSLYPGFLLVAKMYYKKHGVDLPIYTLRYERKPKCITIGKPMYYQELAKDHTEEEILQIFTDYMNSLKGITEEYLANETASKVEEVSDTAPESITAEGESNEEVKPQASLSSETND